MSFPLYASYKDSGVEWLGDVPSHWKVLKAAHAFAVIGSGTTPRSDDSTYYDGGEVPWLNTGDLNDSELYNCERRVTGEAVASHSALKVFGPGSVVIAMYGATIGKLALLRFSSTVNQACCVFSGEAKIAGKFMFYWLLGMRPQIIAMALGGGQPNVNQEMLRSLRVAAPDHDEQNAIAAFLDRETAKIDALVGEQRRLIELLKEKRQAVISHAVTKGLDPNAAMKDSGVEWLGEVPAHWEVRKLRQIAKLESGHTPSRQRPEYWIEEECVVPWFTLADVSTLRNGRTISIASTSQKISEIGLQNSAARRLPAETVILSRTASVGFSGIANIELSVSQDFAAWVCGAAIAPTYLLYCLRAMQPEFRRLMMGSTHQTIYMPDIEAFRVPLPSLDEQSAIIAHIAEALTGIDELIDGTESAIALLQERRSALISAAVTGRIDVRDHASAIAEAA